MEHHRHCTVWDTEDTKAGVEMEDTTAGTEKDKEMEMGKKIGEETRR